MDFSAILAEKDAEILSLRAEIAELKSKLEGNDLEEFVFDTEVSDDEEPMKLLLPEEPEEHNLNMFQDPNAIMQLMQLMMNNNNMQMGQEDDDEEQDEEQEDSDEKQDEEQEDDDEETSELEVIDDIIPESD
jgi:hypothetical protein